MPTRAESQKQNEDILKRVEHFFIHNKESSTGMVILSSMSISTVESAIRKLYLSGRLVRRLVCLAQGSSREVWAYRLTDQEPSLITFERTSPRSQYKPDPTRVRTRTDKKAIVISDCPLANELPHHKLLRTLPLPQFEGYPELEEQEAA
jgi:hypothetical protein